MDRCTSEKLDLSESFEVIIQLIAFNNRKLSLLIVTVAIINFLICGRDLFHNICLVLGSISILQFKAFSRIIYRLLHS